MKAIVIGTSSSGKTTLIRFLRKNSDLPLLEMDEELTRINNGNYPADNEYKNTILAPRVVKDILNRDEIVFFTNTDYFTTQDLLEGKKRGFKVIQLSLDLEKLKNRNKLRAKNEGYSDTGQWLEGMIKYQKGIKEQGLVDKEINTDQPVENAANELLQVLA